jgi:hypothetical protein
MQDYISDRKGDIYEKQKNIFRSDMKVSDIKSQLQGAEFFLKSRQSLILSKIVSP